MQHVCGVGWGSSVSSWLQGTVHVHCEGGVTRGSGIGPGLAGVPSLHAELSYCSCSETASLHWNV